eukprot:5733454-Pyramimonas_sp.AAC.1
MCDAPWALIHVDSIGACHAAPPTLSTKPTEARAGAGMLKSPIAIQESYKAQRTLPNLANIRMLSPA